MLCNLQTLALANALIKSAAGEMIGGGIMRGGLMHGGMGADAVRKGMTDSMKNNYPVQRLQTLGKAVGKSFSPRHPYKMIPAAELNQFTRTKTMFPALSTQEQALQPLRDRYQQASIAAPTSPTASK